LEAFPPEWIGERRKAATFGIGEAEPVPLEFPFEQAVFLDEIRDDLLLVPLQPTGNHGDQDLEDHRHSSGERMMRSFGPIYTQPDPLQWGRDGRDFQPYGNQIYRLMMVSI
jgi:hypothetical protein